MQNNFALLVGTHLSTIYRQKDITATVQLQSTTWSSFYWSANIPQILSTQIMHINRDINAQCKNYMHTLYYCGNFAVYKLFLKLLLGFQDKLLYLPI